MSENKNYIKEETLNWSWKGASWIEKLVKFKWNIDKFNTLNSKIQRINSIASRWYNEWSSWKSDLKKVLNFVLERKWLWWKNAAWSKAYFELDWQDIVLALNTFVDWKKNSSIDSLKKIQDILSDADKILWSQLKIQKHRQFLSMSKSNINSLNSEYQKNTWLVSRWMDAVSILTTWESKIKWIYNSSMENTKNMIFSNFLSFNKDYINLIKDPSITDIQRRELQEVRREYMLLMNSKLTWPWVTQTMKNFVLNEMKQCIKNGAYANMWLIWWLAESSVVAFAMTIYTIWKMVVNSEFRDAVFKNLMDWITFLVNSWRKEKIDAFMKVYNKELEKFASLPQEEQSKYIWKMTWNILMTIIWFKWTWMVLHATPVKIKWTKWIGSLEKVIELNKVTSWKELKNAVKGVEKVRFGKNAETWANVTSKDLLEIIWKLEKGDVKELHKLPKWKIRNIAQELIDWRWVINYVDKWAELTMKKTWKEIEISIANKLISWRDIIMDCFKYMDANAANYPFRFPDKLKKALLLAAKWWSAAEEWISKALYHVVQRPIHWVVAPAFVTIKEFILESYSITAAKELILELDEILRISKLYNKASNTVIYWEKKALESNFVNWNVIFSRRTKDWLEYWIKDANWKVKFVDKFDKLQMTPWESWVMYFEKWWKAWLINNKWEILLEKDKFLVVDWVKSELVTWRIEKSWRLELTYAIKNDKWEVESSFVKYGVYNKWNTYHDATYDRVSVKDKWDVVLLRNDEYNSKIYNVFFWWKNWKWEGIKFETSKEVKVYMNAKESSVSYIHEGTYVKKYANWQVENIKIVWKLHDLYSGNKELWLKAFLWRDWHIHILDKNHDIKLSFKSGLKSVRPKNVNVQSFWNLEIEWEYFKIKEANWTIRFIWINDLVKHKWKIDFNSLDEAFNFKHVSRTWTWIYVMENISWNTLFNEFIDSKWNVLFGDIWVTKIHTKIKPGINNDIIVVSSDVSRIPWVNWWKDQLIKTWETKSYILNMKTKKIIALDSNLELHSISVDYRKKLMHAIDKDWKETVTFNFNWDILERDNGRDIFYKDGTKLKTITPARFNENFTDWHILVYWNKNEKLLRWPDSHVVLKTWGNIRFEWKIIKYKDFTYLDNWFAELITDKNERYLIKLTERWKVKFLFKAWDTSHEFATIFNKEAKIKDFNVFGERKIVEIASDKWQFIYFDNNWKKIFWPTEHRLSKDIFKYENEWDMPFLIFKKEWKEDIVMHINWTEFAKGELKWIYKMAWWDYYVFEYKDRHSILMDSRWRQIYEFDKKVKCYELNSEKAVIKNMDWYSVIDVKTSKTIIWKKFEYTDIQGISHNKWNWIDYYLVTSKDWKKWVYLPDWKKIIEAKYDDISYNPHTRVFEYMDSNMTIKPISIGEFQQRTISHEFRNSAWWLTAIETYKKYKDWKEITNSTYNTMVDSREHLIWAKKENLYKQFHAASISDVMSWMMRWSDKIHPSFENLLSKLFRNKQHFDLSTKLKTSIKDVLDEYIANFKKIFWYELRSNEIDFLKWSFATRVEKEFYKLMNKVMIWERLPSKLSVSKQLYFKSISNIRSNRRVKGNADIIDNMDNPVSTWNSYLESVN